MHNQDLGRVAVVARGTYDPAAEYERLDAVSYNGSSYLVRKHCQGVEPAEGEHYMLMAQAGDSTAANAAAVEALAAAGRADSASGRADTAAGNADQKAAAAEAAAGSANTAAAEANAVVNTVIPDVNKLKDDLVDKESVTGRKIKALFDGDFVELYKANQKICDVLSGHKYIALREDNGGNAMYCNIIYNGSSAWSLYGSFSTSLYVILEPTSDGSAYFGSGFSSTSSYTGRMCLIDVTDYTDSEIDTVKEILFDAVDHYNFGLVQNNEKRIDALESKPFAEKVLLTYGDSITQQHTWQPYVCEALGFASYINKGEFGRRLMAMASDDALAAISEDFDVLVVMGGMNDWIQDRTIGTVSDVVTDNGANTYFTNTFCACVNELFDKLTTRYPEKLIVFMTNTPAWINEPEIFFLKQGNGNVNSNGNTPRDFAEASMALCKKWSIPYVDLNHLVGWNKNNISYFVNPEERTSGSGLLDYIHPKDAGGKRIANWLCDFLKNYKAF